MAEKRVMVDYMHGSAPRTPLLAFNRDGRMETDERYREALSLPPHRPMPGAHGPLFRARAPVPQGLYSMPRTGYPGPHPVPRGPGSLGSLATPREQSYGPLSGPTGPSPGFQGRLSASTPGYRGTPSSPSSVLRPGALSGLPRQDMEGRGGLSAPRLPIPGIEGALSILRGLSVDLSQLRPLIRAPTAHQDPVSAPKGPTEPSSLPRGYTEARALPTRGYTEASSLPMGYTEASSLPRDNTESSSLPKGYTEPSSLPRGYKEASALSRGYSEASSLPKGYTEPSSLARGYTEASLLPKEYTEASTLPKGYTEPSSLARGYTEASSLPKEYTEASTLPKGYTEPNSLPRGYTEASALSRGYTEASSLPKGYTEPSSLARGYTEASALSRGYTEATLLPKEYTEASTLPKGYTEPSSLARGYTEASSLPRDNTESSSLPKGYTEASTLPRGYTEPSTLPKGYTEPNSLPKGYTEPSSHPKGYTEPSSLPRGYTEPNSLSREYQDPLSLPRAPMGQQDTSSFPRSYQESLSLPTGRTGHQQSSLSSGTTPSYQGSFSASQGILSASQRQSYRDSEEQGQPLLHRGSDQQAPYSRSATTDCSVSGGANASHLSAQRGALVTEQGHPFSRLAPSREQTYTQQAHPEHPISTYHAQSYTTAQDQQLSAQGGYPASLEPAANRDSPSGALPASKVRFHGVQDADLTASHSVPQSPSFPSSVPAYREPQSSLYTSKPTAVDQGPASACSTLDTSPSTYRGLPPAPSVLRAARSEDHEGSSSLHTDDLRSGDHYAGPIQIHRSAADVEKRVERPVWSYRRHFRSQSPESQSRRSRSRSPYSPHPRDHSPHPRDRSPQRLVRRSRSPHSSGERYRSPQRPPRSRSPNSASDRLRSPQRPPRSRSPNSASDRLRSPQRPPRSGSPQYHSPRRPGRRSRSPPSPSRYRSTRPLGTRNSSRSPHSTGPGHRSPPRRARKSRSRSPYARRPRPRSPQRVPRRSPGSPSRREGGRNRSRSPRPTRARSPLRRGRPSRSPVPAGHPSRARSPGRSARLRKGPSPRPAARRTKSRSPLPTDPSAAQEGEDSEAAAHAGRGISPAYRMASRLGDSRSPPKSRRGRGGMLHPPGSRNTWASQHPRNPQNSMLASSPPSKQPRNPLNSMLASSPPSKQPLRPLMEEAPEKQPRPPKLQPLMMVEAPEKQPRPPSALQPPKLQPLMKKEAPSKLPRAPGALQPPQLRPLMKEESPAEAGPGRPPRPLLLPRPSVPGRGKGASPATKHSPGTEAEQQPPSEDPEGRPQQHCGVRIEPFPSRSSDKDISFAIFRVFKNFGFVASIEVHGADEGRYCLLFYRDSLSRDRAVEAGPRLEVLRQDVSVAAYDGPETESNVVFRPHAGKGAATKTLMQFSKNATKTLFIKNLDSSLARGDLHLTFQAFGRILEVNVKKKFNDPTSLAFIQYSDTLSVTRAIKAMHGTQLGETTILLSYAKPEPTNCVWIDGLRGVTQAYLHKLCLHYGPVALAALDTVHNKALVFFYEAVHAQNAVNAIKGQRLAGCFVAVDFANYECQTDFYCAMHSTEQDVAALYEYLMGEQ